jgi:hypothetical protein
MMSQSTSYQRAGDTTTIAVLSWAWAAVAVEPTTPPSRWLAVHPADASLAARVAGQLQLSRSGGAARAQAQMPAACAF